MHLPFIHKGAILDFKVKFLKYNNESVKLLKRSIDMKHLRSYLITLDEGEAIFHL